MTTIEVPGTVASPHVSWVAYVGLGAFIILVVAVPAWEAAGSKDETLWVVVAEITLIVGAAIGSLALTHVGRAGRIRLTRRRGSWAALGSRTGQVLLLTVSIMVLLISAGVIILMPSSHPLLWGMGFASVVGIADGVIRLREPAGWRFDQHFVGVTVPKQGSTAFTWNELETVELRSHWVYVTGLGETVKVNGGHTASDPAVVARVIEFYRTNASSRSELTDDRFLERLRSGQL